MSSCITIYCENNSKELVLERGASLSEVAEQLGLSPEYPFLAAYVNHRIKQMDFRIYEPVTVHFIDITHFEGMRIYQRTLVFLLQKAIHDLYPEATLHLKHSVAKGFYGELEGGEPVTEALLERVGARMRELVAQDLPIERYSLPQAQAEEHYRALGLEDKLELLETRPHLYVTLHRLEQMWGYFYGCLATSTGAITLFDLQPYYEGFYLSLPCRRRPTELEPAVAQHKMFDLFQEYAHWIDVMEVPTIGRLNARLLEGKGEELIRIAEAFHEKRIASVADRIGAAHEGGGGRIVLISGPSSSGKTTFAKRLGIQLRILGLEPVLISLDDYFVNREFTPRDEQGEYDYEALEAIDIALFNDHLNLLLSGEQVQIPRYDFITGERSDGGQSLQLGERSVLVVEGIHGLNPQLTPQIDQAEKFRIYLSAFTTISMDKVNRIATTDNRLLRRIVRDHRTRGSNATATLRRWESVRRGEDRYIFPFQEEADVMFNSSLFYEIAVLKRYVEPLLHEVSDTTKEFAEARRLLRYLDHFTPLDDRQIPLVSILREFVGGSSFSY